MTPKREQSTPYAGQSKQRDNQHGISEMTCLLFFSFPLCCEFFFRSHLCVFCFLFFRIRTGKPDSAVAAALCLSFDIVHCLMTRVFVLFF